MTTVTAHGIEVTLPVGWDAQITVPTPAAPAAIELAVLHAASFALPANRGDYGSGAVELMGGSDVLICLLEHEPQKVHDAVFRRAGLPALVHGAFSPQAMQRAMPGMGGTQQFFQEAGRAFCLYVVVGSYLTRGPLVLAAAAVVRSIRISPPQPPGR